MDRGRRRSSSPSLRQQTLGVPALFAALVACLLAGCGPTVTVPNVVGMRLDAAHRQFQALDVDEFDDQDVVGEDRDVVRDHNWVVLSQTPAAGTAAVDTGSTIHLKVGKVDDAEIRDRLPATSPVMRELAAADAKAKADREAKAAADAKAKTDREAKDAADAMAKAAERTKTIREYTEKIDKAASSFNGVLKLYDENAASVRANGGSVTEANNALAAKDFFDRGRDVLVGAQPPGGYGINGAQTEMALAMGTMASACDALLIAIDTGAPSAFAQATRLRNSGRAQWAAAMDRIYGAAHRETPPLTK